MYMVAKIPTSGAIVKYLIENGHSQQELAKILKVDKSYISRVNSGRRNLTVLHLEKLAKHFKMTIPELYLKAVPVNAVDPKYRAGYQMFINVQKRMDKFLNQQAKPNTAIVKTHSQHLLHSTIDSKKRAQEKVSIIEDEEGAKAHCVFFVGNLLLKKGDPKKGRMRIAELKKGTFLVGSHDDIENMGSGIPPYMKQVAEVKEDGVFVCNGTGVFAGAVNANIRATGIGTIATGELRLKTNDPLKQK